MSKKIEIDKKECVNSNKTANEGISALDKEYTGALTSQSTLGTETNLMSTQISKTGSLKERSNPIFVKALIQIMYERGEINGATYENAVKKLKREVERHGRSK